MQVPLPKFVTDAAWQGHSFQWFVKPVPKSPNDLVAPQSANLKKKMLFPNTNGCQNEDHTLEQGKRHSEAAWQGHSFRCVSANPSPNVKF